MNSSNSYLGNTGNPSCSEEVEVNEEDVILVATNQHKMYT